MFLTNRRNVVIAAGVVLLAGAGAAAWIHSAEKLSVTIARNRAGIGADSYGRANARSCVLRQPSRGGESWGGESGR